VDLTPVTLEGRVVRLEPLTPGHLDALCAVGLAPSLWEIAIQRVTSRSEMQAYIDQALAEQRAGTSLPFATVELTTGTIVGTTRYMNIAREHRRLEIGSTWIAPRWQRTGVNTDAKFLLLQHAFDVLGCRRVELKTNVLNARSRAAMLRIGCTEEGILRQHMLNWDGSSRDSVYYSILDGEWPAVRDRLAAMRGRSALPVVASTRNRGAHGR
jgi:RimJ/RimL family protein N-acetyltransferase